MLDNHYKIPESVLVVIHTNDAQVLLLERTDEGSHRRLWQSVTGSKARPDEPLLETAIREIREETGVIVGDSPDAIAPLFCLRNWYMTSIYDIYPFWRHRYAPGVFQNTEFAFSLCIPRQTPIVLSAKEHLRYAWFPARQAAALCFSPSNREAILRIVP